MITGTSGRLALMFGKRSSPVMPGMLMPDRMRIRRSLDGLIHGLQRRLRRLGELHREPPRAQVSTKLLAEEDLDGHQQRG